MKMEIRVERKRQIENKLRVIVINRVRNSESKRCEYRYTRRKSYRDKIRDGD